jgi:hypothetical protein
MGGCHTCPVGMTLLPPTTSTVDVSTALAGAGYAVLDATSLAHAIGVDLATLGALAPLWDDLPPDTYLRDGGHYRRRRHGCFIVDGPEVVPVARRAHWQPLEYNALHGGIERWFSPLDERLVASPAWARLLTGLGATCARASGKTRWHVEAHQFRIDTTDGIGRPTPEGAHRDGVDFVALLLVAREGVKGGETRVFDARGPSGVRFTMTTPWTLLLLDDARVIHESTPIQPTGAAGDAVGHRDTLVLTFRAAGFQGPAFARSERDAGAVK